MEASVVAKEELLLAVVAAEGSREEQELAKEVRRAWKELRHKLEAHLPHYTEPVTGYVLYPQWGTDSPTSRRKLWVGLQVISQDDVPPEVEALTIKKRRYAAAACQGSRRQMYAVHDELRNWVEAEGLQFDTTEGAWTVEVSRLAPVNPFEIPVDEIDSFDLDILYAIK